MLRLGIDLGGSKIEGIVMDAAGAIRARERRPTPQQHGYQAILQTIHDLVAALEAKVGGRCQVGIGTPGALSPRTGLLKNSNTVALNGRPLKTDLEECLARPIRLANDANCFALSEAIDGAGRGQPVVFGVILGTGVGGGIVMHGRVHEGAQRIAGEWGHNILEPDGPPCYCGRNGCVETFLSGPGLALDYRNHGGGADRDAAAIVKRAAAGDALAEAALQRYLERFGRGLAQVINILDPDVVVLGGGLSNIQRLYSEGRERVARYVFSAQGNGAPVKINDEFRTPILPNAHGDSSGVRGAARLWGSNE
jgi:fructokinase